jgi:hypothetical protein
LGNPLGRPLQFKPRRHPLGRVNLHERELTAIGGYEQIVPKRFTIRIGDGGCAIRLDGVRASEGVLTRNLPAKVSWLDASHLTVAVIHLIACSGERDLVIVREKKPSSANRYVPSSVASEHFALTAFSEVRLVRILESPD